MKFGAVRWEEDLDRALDRAADMERPLWLTVLDPVSPWSWDFEASLTPSAVALLNDFFVPCAVWSWQNEPLARSARNLASLFGAGGWPVNLVLTARGVPFFACAWVGADEQKGLPMYLARVKWLWLMAREKVDAGAADIESRIREGFDPSRVPLPESRPDEEGQELLTLSYPRIAFELSEASTKDEALNRLTVVALGSALCDGLTGRFRRGALGSWDEPLLGGTLRATAAGLLSFLKGFQIEGSAVFAAAAAEAYGGLQSFYGGDVPAEAEIPYDRRRSYPLSLVSRGQLAEKLTAQEADFLTSVYGLDRGWRHPVTGAELKAAVPCLNGGALAEGLEPGESLADGLRRCRGLLRSYAEGLPTMPLTRGVSLSSAAWALYASFAYERQAFGDVQPVTKGRLLHLIKDLDQFDELPACFSEGRWIGQGDVGSYGALALALQSSGEEVFALRADQLLRQAFRLFDGAEGLRPQRSSWPFYCQTLWEDDEVPSPGAALCAAALRGGDESVAERAAGLIEESRNFWTGQGGQGTAALKLELTDGSPRW